MRGRPAVRVGISDRPDVVSKARPPPTPGAVELVLAGRLVLRGDVSAQEHRLVFDADDGRDAVLDYASADEGTRPPEQPEVVEAWWDRQ